ncbi:MAG: hypothetical protein R3F19_31615 [Verrucomicrobiales bacterium]
MKTKHPRLAIICLPVVAISTILYADTVYIGDVPEDGMEVQQGTVGPDTANGGEVTYAFFEDTYTNDTGSPVLVSVTEVNFWALNEGVLTPFVAKYNEDDGGGSGGSYEVIAVGDPIDAVFDLNNASFKVNGANPALNVANGEVLVGGFHQDVGIVPWESPDESDGDYLGSGYVLPDELPGALVADTSWSDLGREYRFNIALEFDVEDSDGDGLPDDWESDNELDPDDDGSTDVVNGAAGDPDGDTLTNKQEFDAGTNPRKADTDDDTLADNEELAGAGTRPPTSPTSADTDKDGLSDLVETSTGTFVSATDTGSNPTLRDTDEDSIPDGDEVGAKNDDNFFSDPNLADTDGDDFDDAREISRGTDPNDAADFPVAPEVPAGGSIIVGDVTEIVEGTIGPDGANGGDITYVFYEDAFTNESGAALKLKLVGVNFWAANEGTLTPFIASYNGDGGGLGENFEVLAVGDGIEGEPGMNSAGFVADGEEVFVEIEDGKAIVAGFHQTGNPGMVTWEEPDETDGDFIQANNLIPEELPGPIGGDAGWSDLGREYQFNVTLDEGSSTPFQITKAEYDAQAGTVTITWASRAGADYAVDAGDDFQSWIELDDGVIGDAEQTSFVDSAIPEGARRRFYRVREP